jgi:GDP-L-fucose synthase
MKKILVLGGHGFMGKNLQKVFNNSKYEMFYMSRRDGVDVKVLSSVLSALKSVDPDIIINAAAHVGSMEYVSQNCADIIHDNMQMYITLYKSVALYNKNIIIINPISNCSYPGNADIQKEENWWDGRVHESVESYGSPKKMGYIISECYKKQHNIKTVNIILPNAYGPNDYFDESRTHAMNGVIMRILKCKINNDKKFIVWGTGNPVREWIYMPDACRIIKEIIDNNMFELPNPINIGQEFGFSINEIVNTIKTKLNYDVEIVHDLTKKDGAKIKILSNKLFKKYFNNFVFTKYEEGINNTISYYAKNMT